MRAYRPAMFNEKGSYPADAIFQCVLVLLIAAAFLSLSEARAQTPWDLDLAVYRTPVSPTSEEEDLRILSKLIPEMARLVFPVADDGEGLDPQFIQFHEVTVPSWDEARGMVTTQAHQRLRITGDKFQQAAQIYLGWRREYELVWIASSTGTTGSIGPTPIQLIHRDPFLTRNEKSSLLIALYNRRQFDPRVYPTPNPKYWPISEVFDLGEIGANVQFNLRGGVATVLARDSRNVWLIPFNDQEDPEKWLVRFKQRAKRFGLEAAAEQAREWNLGRDGLPNQDPTPVQAPRPLEPLGESATGIDKQK